MVSLFFACMDQSLLNWLKSGKKNEKPKKVSESPINCITYTNSGVTIQNLGLPRYERFAFYDCHIDVLCSRSGKHSKMT